MTTEHNLSGKHNKRTRVCISLACLILIAAHLYFPDFKVDAVTLSLAIVGILPWLVSVFKSVELPGGFKVELQDVKSATDQASAGIAMRTPVATKVATKSSLGLQLLDSVATNDPNLALVGLRIEIEKKLREISEASQLNVDYRSAGFMLRGLSKSGIIDYSAANGLNQLIQLGNQAAHGAQVSIDAAEWALSAAPGILDYLESIRTKLK